MRRGDVVTVAAPGDYGKPRPAVIIQADVFNDTHASVLVCLLTSALQDAPLFRVPVDPSVENGLRQRSQIMVDKIVTMRREKIGERIGRLGEESVLQLNRSLALVIGLTS